ncbi:hypothetical protein GEMRC1_006042 [Eukaryota sp. GEM-RC1]
MPLWPRKRPKDFHRDDNVLSIPPSRSSSFHTSPLRSSSSSALPVPVSRSSSFHDFSPELLQVPEPDMEVLCRICEDYVPISLLEDHSRYCSVVTRADMRISSCDERLDKIIAAINRRVRNQRQTTSKLHSSSSDDQFLERLEDDDVELLEQLSATALRARNLSDDSYSYTQLLVFRDSFLDQLKHFQTRFISKKTRSSLTLFSSIDSDIGASESTASVLHYINRVERLIVEKLAAAETSSSVSPILSPASSRGIISPIPQRTCPDSLLLVLTSLALTAKALSLNDLDHLLLALLPLPIVSPSISDFEIIKPISRGAFGRVFLAVKKRTGDTYAIKVLKKDDMVRKNQVNRIKTERNILTSTDCPFLIKCYWTFQSSKHLYIVMEYVSGGDLYSLLNNVGRLPEDTAKYYVAEVILSLEYLHAVGIVHRDVKPDNLLVSEDGHIKMIDFGLSHYGIETRSEQKPSFSDSDSDIEISQASTHSKASDTCKAKQRRFSVIGTPEYLAPEIIQGSGHDHLVDWWSLGVLCFELISGLPPFEGDSKEEIFENICNRNISWPDDVSFSTHAVSFVTSLMQLDTSKRLGYNGISEIKAHPFLASIDWGTLLTEPGPFIPVLSEEHDTSYFDSRSPPPDSEPFGSPQSPPLDCGSPTYDDPRFPNFAYKNIHHLEQMNLAVSDEYRRRKSFVQVISSEDDYDDCEYYDI